MNKPVCSGLSILKLSNIFKYEFWCDYVRPNYGEKRKLIFIKILQKILKLDLILQIIN